MFKRKYLIITKMILRRKKKLKQNGDGGNGNDTPSQNNIFELN